VLFRKDVIDMAAAKKDPRTLKWTIYGSDYPAYQWAKDFNHLHKNMKYRILLPAVNAYKLLFGKRKIYQVRPGLFHDKNIVAFESAFNKTGDDWVEHYIANLNQFIGKDTKQEFVAKNNKGQHQSIKMIESFKEVMMNFIMADTAYREYFNMLLFNIAIEMNKTHKEHANHLLYTSNGIMDVKYWVVGQSFDALSKKTVEEKKLREEKDAGNK
jgi:hypothetical protein